MPNDLNAITFEEEKILVSLGNIVKELSNLTGIDKDNIGISVEIYVGYWGKCSLEELASKINSKQPDYFLNYDENRKINITLYDDKKMYSHSDEQKFCYDIETDFNLNEIQFDGKPLLYHCSMQLYYSDLRESDYTGLLIDKDIESIGYNVSFNDLIKDDINDKHNKFFPADLFREVIINCIEKQENKDYQKIRKM